MLLQVTVFSETERNSMQQVNVRFHSMEQIRRFISAIQQDKAAGEDRYRGFSDACMTWDAGSLRSIS